MWWLMSWLCSIFGVLPYFCVTMSVRVFDLAEIAHWTGRVISARNKRTKPCT